MYLFRDCQKIEDAALREARRDEIQQQFNLWPLTAQVVWRCHAQLRETSRGLMLFTAEDYEDDLAEGRAR
jgi:hypothetical protein